MKNALLIAGMMTLCALPAAAQDDAAASVKRESKGIFTAVLQVVVQWVFPVAAAYCFLHGIVGKGVKRGEWDMAAICTLASIALALFPKLLASLFNINLSDILS